MKRQVVCLCGSTRFWREIDKVALQETLAGRIVLSIAGGANDADLFAGCSEAELGQLRQDLEALHRDKIEMADCVLIVNVDDYVGPSTHSELLFARARQKPIRWWVWPTRHALPSETPAQQR